MNTATLSYATMMKALKRRVDYLRQKVGEAEALGRNLTWDKAEMLAIEEAIRRLQEQERQRIGGQA